MELGVRESRMQEAAGEAPRVLLGFLTLYGGPMVSLIPGRRVILTIHSAALERAQFPDKGGGSQTDAALGFSSRCHDDEW